MASWAELPAAAARVACPFSFAPYLRSGTSLASMDCKESEDPYEHSKCTPCRNCMPGQELSKECGDGTGGDAQCVPCPPRKFKDSWGHHSCKPCLSCALINRIQKSNCTAMTNAVCGECLPGFYRKARISGQLGWECIPCTKQTPSSEPQCRSRTNLVKVAVPTVPPQDTALLALTSSALVIIVLVLLALSIIYCKRFWKSQCQRVFLRTQNFSGQRAMFPTSAAPGRFLCEEQMSGPCCLGVKNLSPCYRQAEGPVEAVQFISEGEAISLQLPPTQPELELPSAVAVSPVSKGQLVRSVLESQPLVRSSGCSDRLATALAPSDLRPGQRGVAEALAPLSSCASEMQHKWPHAPVECTELDLQKFSSQVEFVGSERSEEVGSQAMRGVPREGGSAALEAGSSLVVDPARGLSTTVQNPTAESGEQPVNDAQSLVTQISNTMKGLPVAELPHSLVQSLAFLLDPSLNGVKNFSHVALELGVAPQFLGRISGFEQLITHLTYSGDSVTIPHLAQALQRLQRFDALLLLCDHFALSQIQGHQC
ncbi:Tumor necrosis factor receptor superfamily member 27 [Aix galericulata]|nr:Tumor necrosis factor receptor superfamily member 27 [Aix galericulata]